MSKTILLDPGHGGSDPGAVHETTNPAHVNVLEKDLALDISRQTSKLLGDSGYTVLETRTNDIYVSLAERNQQARNVKPDLYLSIHINAGGGTGCEAYVSRENLSASGRTAGTASQMCRDLAQVFNFPDRGLKTANFYTFNNTVPNAILIELGFIDHDYDRQQLTERTAEFATVLANVIRDWMPIEKPRQEQDTDAQTTIDKQVGVIANQADEISQYMRERDEARADLGKAIRIANRMNERYRTIDKYIDELAEDAMSLHDINVKWAGKV